MTPIPTDLIIEIFLRLPAKSVGRFHTLSKQWCLIFSGQDFTDLLRSRPRLLFAVDREGSWSFFSAPQPWSSSLVVSAEFHSRFSEDVSRYRTLSYASGLFYFKSLWVPGHHESVVCNPVRGQYVTLPELYVWRKSIGFIGFEPNEKVFKVMTEGDSMDEERDNHEFLTLGTGELSWRMKGAQRYPHYDEAVCEGICINGVLYYVVVHFDKRHSVVRFDFRSEELKVLADPNMTCTRLVNYTRLFDYLFEDWCHSDPNTTRLVNYKGKLGLIEWEYGKAHGKLDLYLYVLEDISREREEWSEHEYTLPENKLIRHTSDVSVAGVTVTGEIVLAMAYTCKPYYVFYFNPERNTLRSVEIQGFGAFEAVENRGRVTVFLDHVEDHSIDDAVQLKSTGVFASTQVQQ